MNANASGAPPGNRAASPWPPFSLIAFAALLAATIAACVPIQLPPHGPAASGEPPDVTAADLEVLVDQLTAEYDNAADPTRNVAVKRIGAEAGRPLFAAFTYGLPPDDRLYQHKVSLHAFDAQEWLELGRVNLECASYTEESSLRPVSFAAGGIWLTVEGGAGAHGSCIELIRWDGAELSLVISGFSSGPDAGSLVDLNGDSRPELLIDNSDPYVFCYACGVKQYWAQIFYWDGERLVEVTPTPLGADSPAQLRALNDLAVVLANSSLFADALELIDEALVLAPDNTTAAWNRTWILHHLEMSRAEASTSPFPLLSHVFAGDWEDAFHALWAFGAHSLSGSSPFKEGDVAFGYEEVVGELLAQFADSAKSLQPDRAAVHALGAWGRFLTDPDNQAVDDGLGRAADLSADDPRYRELALALRAAEEAETDAPPPPSAAASPLSESSTPPAPDVDALKSQLATGETAAVQQLKSDGGTGLFIAYTYGAPPATASALHTVSIHSAGPGGWGELASVELPCVNYLDESSLQQVELWPEGLWIVVTGGAGAHGGCLELLSWDGERLSLLLSSFNSIPDAGAVTDLNGDGRPDILLNVSDPYIFCYACGVQRYEARFFEWDGASLVETAPRASPSDHPDDLRALNGYALQLAEAGLFGDALTAANLAALMAPADPVVSWNETWIRHQREVSAQLATDSAYPLLGHVFAGDWDPAFDALWETGLAVIVSESPIPEGSPAYGYEETVGRILTRRARAALPLVPERAAVHALEAWGRFLLDPADPEIAAGFQRASELAPYDPRYGLLASSFAQDAN